MRLTAIILISTLLQVCASSFGQRLTLTQKNVSIEKVLMEIKIQTGYDVLVFTAKFKTEAKIDVDFKNAPIVQVMDKIVSGKDFAYSIEDKNVVIKEKTPSFLDRVAERWATIDVRGVVTDGQGLPLPGATITVKGTGKKVVANGKGEFYFARVDEKAVLVISYLGYESREVAAAKDLGKIQLVLADSKLEEVEINAGYYTVKQKEMTGNISRVSGETIAKQPVSNPLAALIGRMAGVNIEQQSGVNGGGFKIEIRGVNSLRADGRQPLYLVDGVPYPSSPMTRSDFGVGGLSQQSSPLNYINPPDIESIEILKDADATAIYGSRGANGVVLIRTKMSKSGKTSVDLNFSSGISEVASKLDLLNTTQYLEMRREAFKNDGKTPGATDFDLNGKWDDNRYTDWQEEFIGGTAKATFMSASISGGNDETSFLFRGNYNKNGTVTPGKFSDQKVSGGLTVNHASINKKFKVNFASSYSNDNNNLPTLDLTQYINLAPNAPALYKTNGNLNWETNSSGVATWRNPLASLKIPYLGKTNTFTSSGLISYQILPGLSFRTSLGYTTIKLKEDQLSPISSQAPSNFQLTGNHFINFNTIDTWIIEPQINLIRPIMDGKLDVLLGSTFQKDNQSNEFLAGYGYISDLLLESITAAPNKAAQSGSSQYKYNSIFGRINYNYKSKYIVNLTGRRDGSSRFGPDRQFANFGALGLAWIFSNENFLKDKLDFVSFGKLRASYGITGSDQIPNYGYLDTYVASDPYPDGSGLYPNKIANPDFSWETNKKLEAAIELGFFKDRIFLSTSWYRNRSSNQLVGFTLPYSTGFTTIQYNLPATVQNSGWEFEFNTVNITNRSFSWKSSINLTLPKNKLLDYPNIAGSSYANTYTVGESLYTPRSYQYVNVDAQTGLHTFIDQDGNNVMNTADRLPAGRSLTSHSFGGVQNIITYHGFSMDFLFQFVNKTAKDPTRLLGAAGTLRNGAFGNQLTEALDRWQTVGQQANVQKFTQSTSPGGAYTRYTYITNSNKFVNASFVRLKNLSLSWSPPKSFIKKVKVNNLSFFVQGQNLITITKYPGDPEVTDILALPTMRTITLGLQVSL